MTLEQPLWQQAGTYSARLDRQLIDALAGGGVVEPSSGGLAVSERAAGANFTVDVAAGKGVVPGTSQADQGAYLCVSTATENVTVPPAPGSGSRIDLVVVRVRDSQVSGTTDDFVIEVVEGTAGGSPVAPAVPADAIALAEILVDSASASVTNAMITDRREASERFVAKTGGSFSGDVTFEGAAAVEGDLTSAGADVAKIKAGTYVGDGTTDRLIATPFDPVLAFVSEPNGFGTAPYAISDINGSSWGLSHDGSTGAIEVSAATLARVPQTTAGGFLVSGTTMPELNESGKTYTYVAIG